MSQGNRTFLRDSVEGKPIALEVVYRIADLLLTKLVAKERTALIEGQFFAAVARHDDEAAIYLLRLLEKTCKWLAIQEEEEKKAFDGGNVFLREDQLVFDLFRELYWQIPASHVEMKYIGEHAREQLPVHYQTLTRTKLAIISRILGCWEGEITERSLLAFRFFIAAFAPQREDDPQRAYEGSDELRARGRRFFDEEQEQMLTLLRERVNSYHSFKTGHLKAWINQPGVPKQILRVLAVGWARAAVEEGIFLRNLDFVGVLDPENRTRESVSAHTDFLNQLLEIEDRARKITEWFQTKANIIVSLPYELKGVHVEIQMPNERADQVCHRVSEALRSFFGENPTTQITVIDLEVRTKFHRDSNRLYRP